MKLIDREPTEDMLEIALKQRLFDALIHCPEKSAIRKLYQVMYDVAPELKLGVKPNPMPSADELERRYSAVMQNTDISAVSAWSEKNHAAKFDAQSYLDAVYADAEEFAALRSENERLKSDVSDRDEEIAVLREKHGDALIENTRLKKDIDYVVDKALNHQIKWDDDVKKLTAERDELIAVIKSAWMGPAIRMV